MGWKPSVTAREIVAAALAVLSPAVYFTFSETPLGAPHQTAAGHGLLLITLPVGLALIWLIEQRPTGGRQPSPIWVRLLLGAAAGLLLATTLATVNSRSIGDIQELPGTSLGTGLESGSISGHAAIRLKDGRTIHLLNAFCGVNGSPVTVFHAKGLLGLDRFLTCRMPSVRPPQSGLPETTPR
ncbi:MAG: hypothetical protein Q7R68_00130 [Nitrospirales bacterium]|nr:hypothetical protein [Nitrospirales bacterium]